jgi:DNA polymerase-3 subunit epsilon
VLQHFSDDLRSPREAQIARDIRLIEWRRTGGELGALLKEARLVKELAPVFNRQLKRENAAMKRQLTALSKLDSKIALAVQRMRETLRSEVGGLAAAVRDSEVESGLAALNRYTALATHPAVLLGDEEPAAGAAE